MEDYDSRSNNNINNDYHSNNLNNNSTGINSSIFKDKPADGYKTSTGNNKSFALIDGGKEKKKKKKNK